MRRPIGIGAVAGCVALALVQAGCGGKFDLPTERPIGRSVPNAGTYQVLSTWPGLTDIQDLLLIAGEGSQQLYLLIQHEGGTGTAPRGSVAEYKRTAPTPETVRSGAFQGLFNPTALCAGHGAGPGNVINRVFVLDQGDTCLARENPATGTCDTTGRFNLNVTHPEWFWKVVEFERSGVTSYGSFTDTTVAFVWGVGADNNGNVYVSGRAILYVPNPFEPRLTERVYQDRIYRYQRGPRPTGGPDPNIVGGDWHRDADYAVFEGSGVGTIKDPRGLYWTGFGPGLFVADFGKNWVQKMRDGNVDLPDDAYYRDEDLQGAPPLSGAIDVCVDVDDFFYVADEGNQRVLRYSDADRLFVQRVDVEFNAPGLPLQGPVAVAANKDEVYVADRTTGVVARYRRR
jgi:hypothetical protein